MTSLLRRLRRKLRDSGRALSDGYRAGGYPDSVAGVYEVRFAEGRAANGQGKDPVRAPGSLGIEACTGTSGASDRESCES